MSGVAVIIGAEGEGVSRSLLESCHNIYALSLFCIIIDGSVIFLSCAMNMCLIILSLNFMVEELTKKKSDLIDQIDYKNLGFLKKFITESGKISPRRVAGTSAKEQRRVNKAIKIARHLALLPFCDNHKQ